MEWGVDFLAGSLSVLVGLSIGYPLDIIKCRMQIDKTKYKTILISCVKIIREEKVIGLYKGFTAPVLNSFPINAL